MTPGTLKEKSETGTPGHKWRPGHREYKWRPGHRDITTKGTPGCTGGYINDDGDSGNGRLAITINKAQGQSLEKCGIDLNTDCFTNVQLYVASLRVGKPDNLFIRTDNGTAKTVVYSQVLRS